MLRELILLHLKNELKYYAGNVSEEYGKQAEGMQFCRFKAGKTKMKK